MTRTNRELKLIFAVIVVLFAVFLAGPILILLGKSLWDGGLTGEFYASVLSQKGFLPALGNSFAVAGASAAAATLLAFLLAYGVHYNGLPKWSKRLITSVATLPMFLPTITYGFAIIYSFGKQGLITRLLGRQLFDIYGFFGLMVGYVIYTIPVAFLLIHNTMGFVDKKTLTVSKVMGDKALSTFWIAVLRPLLGTFAGAFIQAFFLCFTDFGIPASVGGGYEVIATLLYNQMLGGIPDFNRGAVIAMVMLIPSIGTIAALYKFMISTHLFNTHLGLVLLYSGGFGFNFILLYGFFKSVSWSYAEAGFVDGASDAQVFLRIMLPQARPGIIAVAIIQGINVWNDYFNPYMFLQDKSKMTLAVGIYNLVQEQSYAADWPKLFAAMIIATVPVLIVYAIFSNTIIENTVAGGLKG